uniref:Triggering receptor expressed on myeloid cells like 4 n=1 Tax=Prolemur simus TaxID=1328070 RepID=A0A8C8ZRH8_PROSS
MAWTHTCCCCLCCWCSWPQLSVPEELHQVPGQTLSVCEYSPKRGPYQPKAWCRQKAPGTCNIVVTSSKPRTAAQDSRHTIWDEPDAGFFNVTVSQLEETDSGIYWCGIYNSSAKVVIILRKIRLVVSPAPTTSPMWTLTWLPTRTVLITSPEGTSGRPSVNGSETRQSSAPPCRGCAAPGLLVSVLCGLLVVKGLVL